eukprot:CAMPEP_0185597552 /NCGR_PEP_ID=MMETSP0434-20130131/81436_1 /TAXON_ID=626734 ORGANISM="Favella taraikaensis, Strain Fe Narragansett Bay" /NCGR_SAMPLE_ID=MMETSP0434 /ASSEMBLY_ACC=CAM_ASM_000379 /LENGTH=70 /DNA_ID=CAMNT_0028226299 /DNA_START=1540 /DNA_END=1752 /DNA_ORIENTATION=-
MIPGYEDFEVVSDSNNGNSYDDQEELKISDEEADGPHGPIEPSSLNYRAGRTMEAHQTEIELTGTSSKYD